MSVCIINTLSDREAMGFPNSFSRTLLDQNPFSHFNIDKKNLLETLQSTSHSFEERLRAGQLLALSGDPRFANARNPEMISIPGGNVSIGLPTENVESLCEEFTSVLVLREWIEKECPRHQITLENYAIAKYPITHFEYSQFLLATDDLDIPSSWSFGRFPAHLANHPVYTISAEAADRYARWLSHETGRKFRLPSEAEWEFAAAGPEGLEYPWGNIFFNDCANTVENRLLSSSPVGMFPKGRSPFGIEDMAGNVEEYVSDLYRPYPGGIVVDDDLHQVNAGSYRVARGGSFTRYRDLARCKRRHGRYGREIYVMGFV